MRIQNLDFMDADSMRAALKESADFIRSKTPLVPQTVIVLGSGLGQYAQQVEDAVIIPYEDIPHFPRPTVSGHSGRLVLGRIGKKAVAVMQGRNHYYEGYDTQTITFPIRVFKTLGAENLILTNACGAVNGDLRPGDLMLIEDHIAHFCPSPLRGAHLEELGPRFSDMSQPYYRPFIQTALACGEKLGIPLARGVYGYWPGPTYESPAEVRVYQTLGADVVGMSTVAEDIVAVNCGIKVLGISCITNMTCIHSHGVTSHEEVITVMDQIADTFLRLLNAVLAEI